MCLLMVYCDVSCCIAYDIPQIADFEKQRESPLVQKGDGNRLIKDVAAKEHRIALLETELQQQEQLMLGYQRENIKLCQDMKKLKVCLAFVFLSPRLMARYHGTRASVKCLVMALTAAHVSCPTGSISWAGSTKPWLPVSGSSMVYEYLIPATPFAQSSEAPVGKIHLFFSVPKM